MFNGINVFYICKKELEWAVDDYTFAWTMTEGANYTVVPYCWNCKAKKDKTDEITKKKYGTEQLSLDLF